MALRGISFFLSFSFFFFSFPFIFLHHEVIELLLFILCLAFFFFFLNLLDDIFVDNTHEAAVSWDSETVIFFFS